MVVTPGSDRSPHSIRPPRLQKVLAEAGLGSRRACEDLIVCGRVDVDGQTVTELGTRVDPSSSTIRVDGQQIRRRPSVYYAVNKPKHVVSTNRDPQGRPRVIDLVPKVEHAFTVGRLDKASEGLILVTNDGELAHVLTHPRFQIARTYQVVVAGEPSVDSLNQLRRGVQLAEGRVQVASLRVKRRHKKSTILEMVLTEGRNREIRRMAARIGHKVMSLKRIAYGTIRLGDLPSGAYRPLSRQEVSRLRQMARRQRDQVAAGGSQSVAGPPRRRAGGTGVTRRGLDPQPRTHLRGAAPAGGRTATKRSQAGKPGRARAVQASAKRKKGRR